MNKLFLNIRHWIYRTLIAGLLVWLPIWVTYVIINFLFRMTDGALDMLPYRLQPNQVLGLHIPGLGLLFTLIILVTTGLLVTNIIGRKLIELWDRLVARIPLIRSIHSAVKNVLSTLVQPHEKAFRKVMLVEYPRRGVWSVGFLTSNRFSEPPLDEEMLMVFIPTTPNPTSGFIAVIPKKDAIEMKMTVEEALRLVISLGVIHPPAPKNNP